MKVKIATAAALLGLTCSVVAFAYDPKQPALTIGTSTTYPPYEFVGTDGKPAGFDIDLMEAIAVKMGKQVKWYDTGKFDALLAAVTAGKVDAAIAGMSATVERARKMLFSDIYEVSHSSILLNAKEDAANFDDLKGKVGSVQQGTVQETYLTPKAKQHGFTLKLFPKFDDCVLDILTGRTDFTMMDIPVAKKYMSMPKFSGKVKIAFTQVITGAGKAIALPLGSEALKKEIDVGLKAVTEDGTLQKLRDKWKITMK